MNAWSGPYADEWNRPEYDDVRHQLDLAAMVRNRPSPPRPLTLDDLAYLNALLLDPEPCVHCDGSGLCFGTGPGLLCPICDGAGWLS